MGIRDAVTISQGFGLVFVAFVYPPTESQRLRRDNLRVATRFFFTYKFHFGPQGAFSLSVVGKRSEMKLPLFFVSLSSRS